MIQKILNYFLSIGSDNSDDNNLKLKKSSLILVPLIIGPAAFTWGILYIYLDHYISASITLFYTVVSIYNLWRLEVTKDIVALQKIQLILVLLLPFFLMWSLGGFSSGSFVFIWAFFAPIAALTYEKEEKAPYWFSAFMILVIISTLIDQVVADCHTSYMPPVAILLFYFLNVSAGLSGIYFLIKYFISEKEKNASKVLRVEHNALKARTNELEEANNKLIYLSNHDELTQLPNRYYLRENLKKMMAIANRQKHSIALLFLDLDGFKKINDNFGHAMGDKVLQEVSTRLSSLIRAEDTIARLGGDEFVIVLGNIKSLEYVEQVTSRIQDKINEDYDCINEDFTLGSSIGISVYPDESSDIDTLISNADEVMYEVKNSSKNSFKVYKK